MSKDTNTRSGEIVSMASKIIRCLLLLPLAAVLLPGNNGVCDNWGCNAFQLHRYSASTKPAYSTGLDQDASKIRNGATPNAKYFWSSSYKSRFLSSRLSAKDAENDDDDDEDNEKIAKLKADAEAKLAEAKQLKEEAEKAAKLKAEQDKKLKEAQEMLAKIQAEADARKKEEEDTAKQQAEAEEKRKQAEEEAAKLKAEAEAEEEKKRLKAQKKAEEEAAKQKAAEAKKKAEEEAAKQKAAEEAKAKKKAEELATLMKAKEEAARVMAEIDAKLQAQTADADKEEAERVEKLQADAEEKPALDDESDEVLKQMMEEMAKVQKELESRLEKEASTKEKEEKPSGDSADLIDRIKGGAKYDPVAKTVEAEQVKEIPPPPSIKSKEGPIDTTASTTPKPTSDEADKEAKKEEESEPAPRDDPRTKGRSRKENLFDVIGRTASGGVTMDDITKRKNKQPEEAPTPLPTEVVNELKKKGPPDTFGQSVAASYRTNSQTKEEPKRPMPDLTNIKELKKRGPPASFGSYAAAASSAGSPTPNDEKDTIDAGENGPPASFGASVAMASSGEVPKDLLSRGTASTDASSPPESKPKSSRKRDSNIIDVVDVVYTKKDEKKEKQEDKKIPTGSAPPLEVEKTVPQAPALQVEKKVPPMKNPPKKTESKDVVAEEKPSDPIKNIGKAVVENIFGQKKTEIKEETEPKIEEKDDSPKEKGKEDRVAELLKEAFSLSKEDSRVADLLQGIVAITTGEDEKKKEEKISSKKGQKKAPPVEEEDDEVDDDDDYEEDGDDYEDDYEDEEDEDDEEEEPVIMGGRNRSPENGNAFGRNMNRFVEDTRRPGPFGDMGRDGYFEDNDNDYFEYDTDDRWRGRGPGAPRPGGPMQSGGYSVRPPSQSRGDMGSDNDDDYYFLQFGEPRGSRYDEPRGSRYDEPRGSRYDEPRGSGYYNDQDDYYYDDDGYGGAQPGAPRPAYSDSDDDAPKGPPASFGSFVANASMDKTGYAPDTMKENNGGGSGINGGGGGGESGDQWGEEMSQPTGSMLSPRGVKVNGSGGKGGASKPLFVVSEDGSDNGGRKKGPPSNFGKSVSDAGEQQTGFPTRSIEEEIANGGMATPTGSMATPKRKAPANPPAGGGAPNGAPNGAGQKKKPLFVVSEEESGPADFGSSVAEASGSKTGWAPTTQKRATGGLEGGTLGGMRPKLKKKAQPTPEKKEFGDSVFDDCPPVESKKKKAEAELPLSRKQKVESDLNQKHQRNPAVKLVDGGASKSPPKQVRFSGSMMAPRIRQKQQPAQPPAEIEGDSLEEGEGKN